MRTTGIGTEVLGCKLRKPSPLRKPNPFKRGGPPPPSFKYSKGNLMFEGYL